MAWTFILTDKAFTPVGEVINASARKVAVPLSKLATSSFTVRLDNPLSNNLMACDGYIKAYRDKSLMFYGPLISAEESVQRDTATVAVNCVDIGWRLAKRLAGKSPTGQSFTVATDRAQIVKQLIDVANAENDTHIDTSGSALPGSGLPYLTVGGGISAASAVTYTAGPYKFISEIVADLGNSFDGFDWGINPVENYIDGVVTGSKIGQFVAAPVIGSERDEAVFEYGTGRSNVESYTRTVTRDTQANEVYHLSNQGPTYPVVSAIDATSISSFGLLEDLAQADLLDSTLRQALVQEHVNVRKNPRQIVQFTPHIDTDGKRLPQFGLEFNVGDTVPFRAVYNNVTRLNGFMRVWGIEFNIDNQGMERQTLTLADDG